MHTPIHSFRIHLKQRDRRHGFSLIEILAASVVVMVLIAISVPVLNQARSRIKSTVCVSNLRQSGSYLLMHAVENGNVLELKAGGAEGMMSMWAHVVAAMILEENTALAYQRRMPALDVLYCPTFFPYRHDPSVSAWNWASYGLFTLERGMHAERVQDEKGTTTLLRINLVGDVDPSNHPLLMDSIILSGTPQQRMSIWSYAASSSSPGVHMRHKNHAHTVFLDGSVRELNVEELKEIGFTSVVDDSLKVLIIN